MDPALIIKCDVTALAPTRPRRRASPFFLHPRVPYRSINGNGTRARDKGVGRERETLLQC
jgi:hypothetical protein